MTPKLRNLVFFAVALTFLTGWILSLVGLMRNEDSLAWLGIFLFWGTAYYWWIDRKERQLKKLRGKLGV